MNSSVNHSSDSDAGFMDKAFAFVQNFLPHHLLSAGMYWLTRLEWTPFKNAFIKGAIKLYHVNMDEAKNPNPESYKSFNDFFTRELRDNARPFSAEPSTIISPTDGAVSVAGNIEDNSIFQAKGHSYTLEQLLGGDIEWTERFRNGSFATIYLSPKDYHRVHMPYSGSLSKMVHVPGRLFSVNPATTRAVPGLFARNERVVSLFETEVGPMAVILVGAIFVASMDTVWAGTVTPVSQQVKTTDYVSTEEPVVELNKGDEMGRFNMGSTVILLFANNKVNWADHLNPGQPLKMGETIGQRLLQA